MSTKPPSSDREAPEDFWDLGDDDLDLTPPKDEVPTPAAPEAVSEAPSSSVPAAETEPVAMPEPEVQATPEPPAPEPVPAETPEPRAKRPRKLLGTFSLLEKISLLVLLTGLAALAVRGISTYLTDAPQGTLITFDEDFPVQGKNLTVSEVETWWREPIRSGENADRGVAPEVGLIPVARIKLQDSGSATLQIDFHNGEQESVGDTVTLQVANGKFAETGSDEITIICTKGFDTPSRLNPYVNGDTGPWSVVVEESSGSSSDSEPLVKVRIDPTLKE